MKYIYLLIGLFYFVNSRESYLIMRNNFLKFCLKIENYKLKQIINKVALDFQKIHYNSLESVYNVSYKYYTLSSDELELLEGIMFFI